MEGGPCNERRYLACVVILRPKQSLSFPQHSDWHVRSILQAMHVGGEKERDG